MRRRGEPLFAVDLRADRAVDRAVDRVLLVDRAFDFVFDVRDVFDCVRDVFDVRDLGDCCAVALFAASMYRSNRSSSLRWRLVSGDGMRTEDVVRAGVDGVSGGNKTCGTWPRARGDRATRRAMRRRRRRIGADGGVGTYRRLFGVRYVDVDEETIIQLYNYMMCTKKNIGRW